MNGESFGGVWGRGSVEIGGQVRGAVMRLVVFGSTCSVIGSMRKDPASNRRGLAVLLCVRACGCLLKGKDYVSASVIGLAAG